MRRLSGPLAVRRSRSILLGLALLGLARPSTAQPRATASDASPSTSASERGASASENGALRPSSSSDPAPDTDAADEPGPRELVHATRLSDQGELERAASLYAGGSYRECAERLGDLLDPKGERPFADPLIRERARLYHATCLVMIGRRQEARASLHAALEANPTMVEPDRLSFPPPVVDLFLEVRDELRTLIEAREEELRQEFEARAAARRRQELAERQRFVELRRLAAQEHYVVQNRRWLAAVPFGVGQFQNGDDTLGWTFLISEAVFGATAIGSMLVSLHLLVQSEAAANPDPQDLQNKLEIAELTLNVASYGFAALAVGGIVEAQLSFVPERRMTRQRELPDHLRARPDRARSGTELSVAPAIAPVQGGLQFGFQGRF